MTRYPTPIELPTTNFAGSSNLHRTHTRARARLPCHRSQLVLVCYFLINYQIFSARGHLQARWDVYVCTEAPSTPQIVFPQWAYVVESPGTYNPPTAYRLLFVNIIDCAPQEGFWLIVRK